MTRSPSSISARRPSTAWRTTSRARRIRADGTDEDALRRAGAEGADRFFALTEGDNRNILAAQLAAERFDIKTVVAKINDPVRAEAYAALGLATICRTTMMVETLARFLGLAWHAAGGRAEGLDAIPAPTGSHHDAGHALAAVRVGGLPMYVIVVGGGKVGYYLTKELLAAGHELVLLEKDGGGRVRSPTRSARSCSTGTAARASTSRRPAPTARASWPP